MADSIHPSFTKARAMPGRILIVDDDAVMLQALAGMVELRVPTVTIETCESGTAALERIRDTDYDAIVSDVKMPGMDGFQLMERVLTIRPTTPTLLVTGHGDHDLGVKALDAGAYAFIPKPIDRDFFLAWLKRAMQLRQLSRSVEQQTQALEQTVQERTTELQQNNRQLQAVAELHQESESLYRSVADAMPQIVYTAQSDGAIDYVNQQWVEYTGASKDQALKLWMDAMHSDDVAGAVDRWNEAVRDGSICETEYRLRRTDGAYRWHLSRAVPQRDRQGRIGKWIGTLTDIHDRKSSEEALRVMAAKNDSRARVFDTMLSAITDFAYIFDRQGRFLFVNQALLDLWGLKLKDAVGKNFYDLQYPDALAAKLQAQIQQVFQSGERLTDETAYTSPTGVSGFYEYMFSPVRADDGSVEVVAGSTRNITTRKRTEEALRHSEAQRTAIISQAPIGMYLVDDDLRLGHVNPKAWPAFGNRDHLIGRDLLEIFRLLWPHEIADDAVGRFRHTLDTGEPYIASGFSGVRADRDAREHYDWEIHRVTLPDGRYGVVCYFTDISSYVSAQRTIEDSAVALRQSQAALQFTLESAQVGDWDLNLITDTTRRSLRHDRCFGYQEPVAEWGFETFIQHVHPEDRVEIERQFRAAVVEHKDWHFECRVVWPDHSVHWIAAHGSLYRTTDGKPARMLGIVADITERKLANQALRDQQTQLVQAAKLASIGELASGVAHELNNPLNNIGLFLGNMIDYLQDGPVDPLKLQQTLQTALEQVKKAAAIISHLRTFARTAAEPPEPVAVHRVMHSAVSLVEAQLRLQNVDLTLNLCSDDPVVLGHVIQLEQVFINLLTNAKDAVETSTDKRIMIESTIRGTSVDVTVHDSGSGIPPEHQSRIFDPFFTTKEIGKGTGLGLSISYGIIKDHHGRITVHSESGKGTMFLVELPMEPLLSASLPDKVGKADGLR